MGSHVGTGYKSNYRPLVSYQPHLDTLDNPAMGYSFHRPFPPTSALLDFSHWRCHCPTLQGKAWQPSAREQRQMAPEVTALTSSYPLGNKSMTLPSL